MEQTPTLKQLLQQALQQYAHHPALMLPFLIQGAMGVGVSWLYFNLSQDALNGPIVGVFIVVGLSNFLLQLCGIRWSATITNGESLGGALKVAARSYLRAFGLIFIAAVPISLLIFIFVEGTEGVFEQIGLSLSFALLNLFSIFGFIGMLDARLRFWPAVKEAGLVMAASPLGLLVMFGVFFGYAALEASLSGNLVAVGVSTLEAGRLGVWGTVLWIVLNVLWQPLLYTWLIGFHRAHREPQLETRFDDATVDAANES